MTAEASIPLPPDRRDGRRPLRMWLARRNIYFAWALLLVAVIHPPHGLGVTICWMRAWTDTPCPGCGLTRSVSSAARGMWAESWAYHPFGIALLTIFTAIAAFGLLPRRRRRPLLRFLLTHRTAAHLAYTALISTFILYGALRAINTWLH